MTIQDDTYARAKALAAAIKLHEMRLPRQNEMSHNQFQALNVEEVVDTARSFEIYIRSGV